MSPSLSTTAPFPDTIRSSPATLLSLALLAAVAWSLFGFEGFLYRDDAVYVYGGQRLLAGEMPYSAIFDHKTPLAVVLCAAGSGLGRLCGVDDLLGARLLFGLLCVVSVPMLFVLVRDLTRSPIAGWIAALALIATWSYGRQAIAGPNAKTPYVFFEIWFLLAASRQRWFQAGIAGALATWVWQPGVGFLAVGGGVLVLQWWKNGRSANSRKAAWSFLLGIATPTLPLLAWFTVTGALGPLLEGSTFFNLRYLRREEIGLLERFTRPWVVAWQTNAWMGPALCAGLAAVIGLLGVRARREETDSRWRVIVASFPVIVLFALLDFQGAADFYPFLPFAALGLGWLVARILACITPLDLRQVLTAFLLLGLSAATLQLYHTRREHQWLTQRYLGRWVLQTYGAKASALTIGLPEFLVATKQTNPNRYVFILNGIDNLIATETEDGFAGWIAQLEATRPAYVTWGPTELSAENEALLNGWLEAHYKERTFGYWTVFERVPETAAE